MSKKYPTFELAAAELDRARILGEPTDSQTQLMWVYHRMDMPALPNIERYYASLAELIEVGGSDNELNIRPAFQNCLAAYCAAHRDRLVLVPELRGPSGIIPDGTVLDSLRMTRGLWEAKDSHDNLDAEIQSKFERGYPRSNIIFEDSRVAVLFQNGGEAMRVDMTDPAGLHRLIGRFLDYELPEIGEFRQARQQFAADLPSVLENLRQAVADAEVGNAAYQDGVAKFLELCHRSIGPAVSEADVREMLLQHILTQDIFQRVFAEVQYHSENNIARQLSALERTFFTGDVRRQAIDRLRAYYGAIGRAADEIAEYSEKQKFLKAVYEDFYKAYNPAAADRLGVVYTPNEVVDFIIRGADHLLQKHFGRSLADENVQILDPATGTGTFVTSLIDYLPADRLEYKYLNEIHANEVAILPYYIANLNIEYSYKERTGKYLEFPNLCFVDTLDNMDWQQAGATGGAIQRQGALFNLGGMSEENWLRVQEQNDKTISVIIGNPPYNASATIWNDGGANREYPDIDKRIRDSYIAAGTARKTSQYDMYKRFVRWASDRLADNGIIGFVSNSAFLDARQDDGFRKILANEFNELWAIDLKGNARTSGERRKKEGGNVFSDKIRVGVAIYFLIRKKGASGFQVYYNGIDDYTKSPEKVDYVRNRGLDDFQFAHISPDTKANWLKKHNQDFDDLLPLVDRISFRAEGPNDERSLFKLHAPGVMTGRDEWVYDFSGPNLRDKALFFADTFNELSDGVGSVEESIIKWSRDLGNEFRRGKRIIYSESERVRSLFRPFTIKWHYANFMMNDVLTKNHYAMFGSNLNNENIVIFLKGPAAEYFSVLTTDKVIDYKCGFTGNGGTFCLPLYQYTGEGQRVSNITEWGLRQFREHYDDESITAEDIFAYTYAALHDPAYRESYAVDLLREFPRLPFHKDFPTWVRLGQELLDLHIGFEDVEPFALGRVDKDGEPGKAALRADKARSTIVLDSKTILTGVPVEAWDYRLGSRSALEWVLDQYKERTPRDPTIRKRFNTYRFADHKERVIDLLQRVCTVSVETVRIVSQLNSLTSIEPEDETYLTEAYPTEKPESQRRRP